MKITKNNMFHILIEIFNRVIFLKQCYRNYIRLIKM